MLSLLRIRKHWAGPLAWLMVLAMLSPVSPHLVEGIALCLGEDHIGVEATGASHHEGLAAPLASAGAENIDTENTDAQKSSQPAPPRRTILEEATQASTAPSSGEDECVDVPLRLVKTGDTCYQAVPSSSDGEQVSPLFASQTLFARVKTQTPSPGSDARESRRAGGAAPTSPSPSSSTVVLLI